MVEMGAVTKEGSVAIQYEVPARGMSGVKSKLLSASRGLAVMSSSFLGYKPSPGDEVYEDQIVGIHAKGNDLKVNICKAKQLTNMRSSGADEKSTCTPAMQLTLEDAVEYVVNGEFVEVTPDAIRMGKHPKADRFAKK